MSTEAELEALLAEAAPQEVTELDPESNAQFLGALKRYAELRSIADRLSKAKKDNEEELAKLSEALVPVFEAKGIKSIKVEGVGTVTTAANNWPSVNNQDALFTWLRARGEDGIIKRTVHPMTLKSFMNERLDTGKELPPEDVMTLTGGRILKLTRSK